jgi:hypothetical protein
MKKKKQRKKPVSEEDAQLFKELCDAVNQLGIEIRVEEGNFQGGVCLVEGEKEMLFINKKHPVDRRIALIISELKRLEISPGRLPKELLPKIEKWF